MSSVETLSPSLISTGALRRSSTGAPRGTGLMFGPFRTSTAAASAGADGRDQPGHRGEQRRGPLPLGRGAGLARVGDPAGERGGGGGQGRAEVDRVVLGAAPAREVAVERAQAAAARGRHVADARARPAGGLGDAGARGQQGGEQALARHHLEDAVAAREDHEGARGRDPPALEHARHRLHVLPGGVGAGADHDLLDRLALDLGDRAPPGPASRAGRPAARARPGRARSGRRTRRRGPARAAATPPRARGGGSTRGWPRRRGTRWW